MANPPRNSTRIKPTPTGKKMTKGNAKVLPSVTTANVNDTLREGQENLPPVSHLTSTPRSGIVVNSSPLSAAQKTPLRTSRASVTVNHQSGGGHVISQPANALNRERAEKERLQLALASRPSVGREPGGAQQMDRLRELEAELDKERALVARLRTQTPSAVTNNEYGNRASENETPTSSAQTMIPRPRGVAGKDYCIQIEMGLATSERNDQKYSALMRGLRDLVIRSQINWELPWADIPASEKAKLFSVARERHPILARYVNDWATVDIVRRYIKNKRSHHYKNGWLDVPEKYSYLKNNSRRRNPDASRTKRAKAVLAAKKRKGRGARANVPDSAPVASDDMYVNEEGFNGGEDEEEEFADMDQ